MEPAVGPEMLQRQPRLVWRMPQPCHAALRTGTAASMALSEMRPAQKPGPKYKGRAPTANAPVVRRPPTPTVPYPARTGRYVVAAPAARGVPVTQPG